MLYSLNPMLRVIDGFCWLIGGGVFSDLHSRFDDRLTALIYWHAGTNGLIAILGTMANNTKYRSGHILVMLSVSQTFRI